MDLWSAGHSLRAGLVTTGARVGVNMVEIVSQTVVKPIDAVAKCIREARLFDDTVTRRIRL